MRCVLCWLFVAAAALTISSSATAVRADEPKWVSLFDGSTLDGWEKVGGEKSIWEVKDGAICGSGLASMLV